MKNLLITLSTLSLLATPIITLESAVNTSTQQENLKTEVNNLIKDFNITSFQNYVGELTQETDVFDSGSNDYEYYFGYHVISFSHDVTRRISDNVLAGAGAVASIIGSILSVAAPIAAAIAAILVVQWLAWDVSGHDKGSGVTIKLIGFGIPQYIVDVSSQ
ncbi:hypothetical protein [Spiroplasma platyhelix]|uniref:Uncharacterized protein n=1 Tax=Spiroplasma platyhelix PALS-1 TaxID=1276218 RepID=A0A846U219_9MOLU|nr:hypothetical protein [Spiroplasma platyhelix]MBE4704186.1 hypothetical protein [Spiroplasma platyhelix PALS-1]NKE38559.1 hypothetical protein [Spiroplasma platyhelix PALS-1]UJB28770.1 hypothetical protein SPLAT_v1c00030 [Spiroplasma platyhelix PALS-1]